MSELSKFIPHAIARSITWRRLRLSDDHEGYFFLSVFVNFAEETLLDLKANALLAAQLHTCSIGKEVRFGAPTAMFDGLSCYVSEWASSWTRLFP
jgi:hypothetical protein